MKQDTQGADNALHAVLASKEKVFGLEHPETLATVDQLAKLNLRIGDLKEAMTFFQREYDVQMSTLSGPADESVISTINSLASIHIKLGQLPEAEALFKKVADLKAQNFGPTDARVVSSYNNMGYVSCFQDKYPQAEEYFGKSDAIEEQGGIQPTIKAKDNIAYCQSKQ
jgi:tetratricopeptide (TPR) repeat protein